ALTKNRQPVDHVLNGDAHPLPPPRAENRRTGPSSSLQTVGGDPLHQVALEEQKDDEHGNDRQNRHGKQISPLGAARAVDKHAQAEGNRVKLGVRQIDELSKKVVPCPIEGENGHGDDRGTGEGENDQTKQLKPAAPVDVSRFVQFLGNAPDKLNHQVDEEGHSSEKAGQRERKKGVDPPDLMKHDVLRNHDDLRRQHHGRQHESDQKPPRR